METLTFAPSSTALLARYLQIERLWVIDEVEHNCPMACILCFSNHGLAL